MEMKLSRNSFFALAAMMGARDIFGLDPNTLLPQDEAERMAAVRAGERDLQTEDLMRVNDRNEAVLEATLGRLMTTVVDPDRVAMTVRAIPDAGRQLLLHYRRDGQWVEQTLPDDQTHRLAEVGDDAALVERLCDAFDTGRGAATTDPAFSIDWPLRAFMAVTNTAMDGDVDAARALTGQQAGALPVLEAYLTDTAAATLRGTISLAAVGGNTVTTDVAVVAGPGLTWVSTGVGDDAELIRTAPATRAELAGLLAERLAGL
jgi:hypothetical protein